MSKKAYIIKRYKTRVSANKFLAGLLPDIILIGYEHLNYRVEKGAHSGDYLIVRDLEVGEIENKVSEYLWVL